MIFKRTHSKLEIAMNQWVFAKKKYQKLTEINKNFRDLHVTSKVEAEAICDGLEYLQGQFASGDYSNLNDNFYSLAVLFQQIKSKEAYKILNDRGILLLAVNFNSYQNVMKEKFAQYSYIEPAIFSLKIFANYSNPDGTKALINAIKSDFAPDEYLWSVIFDLVAENDNYNLIMKELGDFLPGQFAGISYLDMCNRLAIEGKIIKHPFDSEPGFQLLKKLLLSRDEDKYSYAVSTVAAIPFIKSQYQQELIKLAATHPDINVRIESAWAGAKLGQEQSLRQLVEFARNFCYGHKPLQYLKELGKESMAPTEIKNEDFQALAEMCNWLSHPNEFGSYPDEACIFDKRELYWPPANDHRTMYIIKYTYKGHNDDGSDDTGVGMVGSTTFCLFGIDGLAEYPPEKIYAIHCAWEMDLEDYSNPEPGLKILRKHNPNL